MAKAAGSPKKQKAKPKLTNKEQSERFKQTARDLGVDESGKRFELAINEIFKASSQTKKDREKS